MVIKRHAGLKIAFGENPKRVYGDQKKMPYTRMGVASVIREAFYKAQEYQIKKEHKEEKEDFKYDMGLEAIGRVLRKEMPLRAHAHKADDIITALRIAEEFDVNIIIEHCSEGHLIAELLKSKNVKVAFGPLMMTRCKMELKDLSYEAPRILHEHGVKFAIMSDHPVVPSPLLNIYEGFAARYGLPEYEALKAITISAAEILGIDDKVGSIAAGKDADIVVWDDFPLKLNARQELVMIDGKIGYIKSN